MLKWSSLSYVLYELRGWCQSLHFVHGGQTFLFWVSFFTAEAVIEKHFKESTHLKHKSLLGNIAHFDPCLSRTSADVIPFPEVLALLVPGPVNIQDSSSCSANCLHWAALGSGQCPWQETRENVHTQSFKKDSFMNIFSLLYRNQNWLPDAVFLWLSIISIIFFFYDFKSLLFVHRTLCSIINDKNYLS